MRQHRFNNIEVLPTKAVPSFHIQNASCAVLRPAPDSRVYVAKSWRDTHHCTHTHTETHTRSFHRSPKTCLSRNSSMGNCNLTSAVFRCPRTLDFELSSLVLIEFLLSTPAPSYRFRSTVLKAMTAPAEICIPNIFAAAFPEPLRSLTTIAFTGVASVSDLDWLEDCAMDSRC